MVMHVLYTAKSNVDQMIYLAPASLVMMVAKCLMSASDLLVHLVMRETNALRIAPYTAWNMKRVVLEEHKLMDVPLQT